MQDESISLYCRENGSDKVYHAQLTAKDGGFMVTAQNGPRGGTLTARNKTPAPVEYAKAKKAYDALVREKMGKGYVTGEAGKAYVGTDLEARFTGIVPQLLNPITEDEVEQYLTDPAWVLQEKYDGHRRLTQVQEASFTGINRKGLSVPLPEPVAAILEPLRSTLAPVTDGELMGDVYAIFDVLELGGKDMRALPYSERLVALQTLQAALPESNFVFVTRTAYTEADKRELFARLKAERREGGVFKRLDAKYVPGRPANGGTQLKRQFRQRATLIVAPGRGTKRSMGLELLDAAGQRVKLGNVTIPSNYDVPTPGTLVEVEYLYAYVGGALAQPQYLGVRDDIELAACTTAQLHYKAAVTDEDEDNA